MSVYVDRVNIRYGRMVMCHMIVSRNSCRPIGTWGHHHVFAYLVGRDLPIHPAYACSLDGTIDRAVLRMSTIGGERGRGFGRQQWERPDPDVLTPRQRAALLRERPCSTCGGIVR